MLAFAVLAGCSEFERRQNMSDEDAIFTRGWARPDARTMPPQFCYRTIAIVDCHAAPDAREHARREGYPLADKDPPITFETHNTGVFGQEWVE